MSPLSKSPVALPLSEPSAWVTDVDAHLFAEGTHRRAYLKLGAHPGEQGGALGTHFAVWAPGARSVSVLGHFNGWDALHNPLLLREGSGIWSGFIPGVRPGDVYKYHIESQVDDYRVNKADPFASYAEVPPRTASIVWSAKFKWQDQEWIEQRKTFSAKHKPMSIYELHLGSWERVAADGFRSLNYREMAPRLAAHVERLGFTHVELMPVMEHPFFASWGYQVSGYFAPSSRYGTPDDFMFLVDYLHRHNIGVILDWVPAHFPSDEHSLGYFDGTYLFEHSNPQQRIHPEWTSLIYNYGRHEVRSFLISNAIYWLDVFHADGLRVDGVSSMLYLDYGRNPGEWVPNQYGGRENIEAIDFLRQLNSAIHEEIPGAITIAEESTAWPQVTGPTASGGLGFDMKWDMGWMHDTLRYMKRDPIHRKHHHDELTFRRLYAYNENYVLPLSHDEVVHGKGSLYGRMPRDEWQKFAGLRLLLAYMYGTPGKKLLFMGAELGQPSEWNHDASLEWHLAQKALPQGLSALLARLNELYRSHPALYERDFEAEGFDWVDANNSEQSVLAFSRYSLSGKEEMLVVFNFTPEPRHHYRFGVGRGGTWREVVNTDAAAYGGSNLGNMGQAHADAIPCQNRPFSLALIVPPLAALFLEPVPEPDSILEPAAPLTALE